MEYVLGNSKESAAKLSNFARIIEGSALSRLIRECDEVRYVPSANAAGGAEISVEELN